MRHLLLINLGYAGAVAALALSAAPPRVLVLSTTDWLAHGLAYGLQVVLLHQLLRRVRDSFAAIGVSGAIALVFGAVLEASQLLQPARVFELVDLAANTVGIAVAMAVISAFSVMVGQRNPERSG